MMTETIPFGIDLHHRSGSQKSLLKFSARSADVFFKHQYVVICDTAFPGAASYSPAEASLK